MGTSFKHNTMYLWSIMGRLNKTYLGRLKFDQYFSTADHFTDKTEVT